MRPEPKSPEVVRRAADNVKRSNTCMVCGARKSNRSRVLLPALD
jgi:hypothetical protein